MKVYSGVFICLSALVGAVFGLPASLLEWPVAHMTNGMWRLSRAQGSVWQGQGQWMFVAAGGTVLPMSRMEWSFQPLELLSGRVAWQISSDGAIGSIKWWPSRWELHRITVSLPMEALASLSPQWQGRGFSGRLIVSTNDFIIQSGQYSGNGRAEWKGATSRLTQLVPIGSYALDVAGTGGGVVLHLGTLSGKLMVEGDGRWEPGGALTLAGEAKSTPEHYEALKPLLLMLGQPDGPTSIRWRLAAGH